MDKTSRQSSLRACCLQANVDCAMGRAARPRHFWAGFIYTTWVAMGKNQGLYYGFIEPLPNDIIPKYQLLKYCFSAFLTKCSCQRPALGLKPACAKKWLRKWEPRRNSQKSLFVPERTNLEPFRSCDAAELFGAQTAGAVQTLLWGPRSPQAIPATSRHSWGLSGGDPPPRRRRPG